MMPSARKSWHDAVLRVAEERHLLRPRQCARIVSLLDHGLDLSQVLVGSGLLTPEAFSACIQEVGQQEEAVAASDSVRPLRAYEAGGHVLMSVLEEVQGPIHEQTHGSFWPALRARQTLLARTGSRLCSPQTSSSHPLRATQAWRLFGQGTGHVVIERADAETQVLLEPYLRDTPSLEGLRTGAITSHEDARLIRLIYGEEDGMLDALLLLGYRMCVHTKTRTDSDVLLDALTSLGHHAILYRQQPTTHGPAWLVLRV